jgi:hypothetical protein
VGQLLSFLNYPYPTVCYLCSAHRHRLFTAACLPVHTAALLGLPDRVAADKPPAVAKSR